MATVQSANSTTFKFGRANNTNMNFYFKFIGTPNTTARTITCTIELWVKYAYDYDFTFYTSQGSYIKIGGTNLMTSNINYNGSGTVKLKTYTKTFSYDSNGQCKVAIDAVLKSNNVLNLYDRWTLGYSDAASRYNISMSLKTTVTLPSISAITKPSVPGNQKVNGSTNVTVLQKTDNLNLTWSAASGGTYGVTGYKIYWSVGSGWQHLATVDANTTSYTTKISNFNNSMTRGSYVGFQITTYNSHYESAKKSGATDNNQVQFASMRFDITIPSSGVNTNSALVNWTCNIPVSILRASIGSENNYYTVSTGMNTTSGSFRINGLTPNTTTPIFVKATSTDTYTATDFHLAVLKQVALFTYVPSSWKIEDPLTVTISNPGGCSMNLYIAYNGIEIIGRSNITLNSSGQYTLTLSQSELNSIYSATSTNANPSFTIILRSYQNSVKVGEDSRTIGGTVDTHAWVKVGSTWKKAKVWLKVGSTWKISTPWVKVGSTWRRA